jgi:hypothetical protein
MKLSSYKPWARLSRLIAITSFAVLAILGLSPTGHADGGLFHRSQCPAPFCPPCDPCEPSPWTMFRAGLPGENLQVNVVGSNYGSLEIYFKLNEKYQNFQVVSPEEKGSKNKAANLHINRCIILAPANPSGTFAVRYGPYLDNLMLYAWKSETSGLAASGPHQWESGCPVCPYWVTSHILRVKYGRDAAKTKIIRFDSNSDNWSDPIESP